MKITIDEYDINRFVIIGMGIGIVSYHFGNAVSKPVRDISEVVISAFSLVIVFLIGYWYKKRVINRSKEKRHQSIGETGHA